MQSLTQRLARHSLAGHARASSSVGLIYHEHGRAEDVLQLVNPEVRGPDDEEVLVQMMAAPLNPADVNMIEGTYPTKPTLPATPGNEGVGIVAEVGSKVEHLSPGSWVVPLHSAMGTWRKHVILRAQDCHPVPSDLPIEATATLCINPPSALRMLEEFVSLQAGDVVIQNGANSAVGRLVIQLAQAQGIKTINLIRDRPDPEALEEELAHLGATVVTTEAGLKATLIIMSASDTFCGCSEAAQLPQPSLALNCVGGSSSAAIAKMLRSGGTIVTYGGMSMKPVSLPTSLFIFKDLHARGFWLSGGSRAEDVQSKKDILDRLIPMVREGQLFTRTEDVALRDYKLALQRYRQGRLDGKLLFRF